MKYLHIKILLASAAISLLCSQAWAINKCTGPDGKVSFQDAPCVGKGEALTVTPASGKAPPSQATTPGGSATPVPGKPQTEAQRIEAQIAASQQDRRKLELEARLVPDALNAISRQRSGCDQELKTLQERKQFTNNNLAGATLQGAISSEMTAIATRCATRNTEVREDYEALRKECRALGGCK